MRPISIIRNITSLLLASSLLLTACDVKFAPDVKPLVIEEAGDQPFQDSSIDESESIEGTEENDIKPIIGFGGISSTDAIALCNEREFYGDNNVGSCLAPGGESYFVWTSPDNVIEVARDSPFYREFLAASQNRANELGDIESLARDWPKLALLFGEFVAAGGTCAGTAAGILSGVGIWLALGLGGACAYSTFHFFDDAVNITKDAEELVNSINDFGRFSADAEYNYCRMEGFSDGQCR